MAIHAPGIDHLKPRPARHSIWRSALGIIGWTLVLLMLILLGVAVLGAAVGRPDLAGNVLALALPAFLAGTLSMLSPCSLPILIGYFSLAAQQRRERIGLVTVSFLTGIATTMTILGASFTAIGSLVIEHQRVLTLIGGCIVIGFGVMSLLGKGFAGLRIFERPAGTVGGAYVYGAIFALGWTTCVGPILGSILTLLLAQGSSLGGALSLVAGGVLALIYVIGLGVPLMILVSAVTAEGPRARVARLLRGRGWEIPIGGRVLYLHSTAIVSGVLLISLGVLLATGQMTILSERLAASSLAQLGVEIEAWLNRHL